MIKLAIVGTGGMANTHAKNYKTIKGCKVVACCDVVKDRVEEFAKTHGILHTYTDFDKMLREEDFDALSNVTPDSYHAPLSIKAVEHGKHVLCEKPLAVNYKDALKMAYAAKKAGVINMVNLSYRNSAAINKAAEIVQSGAIGKVVHVSASYLQSWLATADYSKPKKLGYGLLWRLSTKHGSKGVLGDLGVHILDFLSYPAGDIVAVNCRLKTFHKLKGDRVGEYVFDANDTAVMTVEMASGAVGTVHTTRYATGHGNSLRLEVNGMSGAIIVDLDESYDTLHICTGKKRVGWHPEWKTIKAPKVPNIYQRFIMSIKSGKNLQPDFARGAKIQQALDACFESDRIGKTVRI